MQDRTARIAARIFKEAAAEEKPPRDDLRKRYKTEDFDKADRKDFSDTAADPDLKAAPQVGQLKFRYRLYCSNSLFSFIAFLPTIAVPELFVAARRAFERDFRKFEDYLAEHGYPNTEVYRLEQDETRDGHPIMLFRGNLHDSQDNRLLETAANSVGAEYLSRQWRGESANAARRLAAGMRAPSRSFLEKEIRQMAAKGVDAAHRLNDNLYLVAEAKGNPRGAVMEFHWQNYRGDSFGFATVEEDRFNQHTPARAAAKLLDDFAKSSLRIFR